MSQKAQIVVVDFGAQYAHLIARRVRQLGVFSKIMVPGAGLEKLEGAKGVILSGGPSSVYDKGAPSIDKTVFELGKPVLGLCYGHQLMAQLLGGRVARGNVHEYGTAELDVGKASGLFAGLAEVETVWMSHGDRVEGLPKGFKVLAGTSDCETAAVADLSRKFFGLQFHPEVTHTPHGLKVLENFVFGVCGCKKDWSIEDFVERKTAEIRKQVRQRNVFLLASGGVDSTVALSLLNRALGRERVKALHVDTGFMRKNESEKVVEALKKQGFSSLDVVDGSEAFFRAVEGLADPEKKREAIGRLFVEIQRRESEKLGLDSEKWVLGQGTIYPDTIETAETRHAAKIKTHHNRVPAIKAMIEQGKVVEPISLLYKDEVRELGEILGLPHGLVWRHPFPGPGLAIRCLCSKGEEKGMQAGLVKKVNSAVAGLGFSALTLPVRSVGVQGDARTYAHPAVLQGPLDWKKLEKASTLITNRFSEVNRCVYSVAPEKIESVELKQAFLTRERVKLLQEADAVVMEAVAEAGLMEEIWQFPSILLPLKANGFGEALVLRPVESKEAMTARFYPMKKGLLGDLAKKLMDLPGISAVFYDVTHKPPGTIEWE